MSIFRAILRKAASARDPHKLQLPRKSKRCLPPILLWRDPQPGLLRDIELMQAHVRLALRLGRRRPENLLGNPLFVDVMERPHVRALLPETPRHRAHACCNSKFEWEVAPNVNEAGCRAQRERRPKATIILPAAGETLLCALRGQGGRDVVLAQRGGVLLSGTGQDVRHSPAVSYRGVNPVTAPRSGRWFATARS